MNRSRLQKRALMRPSDALLPVALLAASLSGRSALAFQIYSALMLTRLLSLATSSGLRIAFAEQPSYRQVRGSVLCALMLQLFGGLACAGLGRLAYPDRAADALSLAGIGALLNIEHVFYEYLYSVGDRRSAALSRALTALLTFCGMLLCPAMERLSPVHHLPVDWLIPSAWHLPWPLVTSAISALVAAIIGTAMGDGLKGRPNAQPIRSAPRAMLQAALYPAAAVLLRSYGIPITSNTWIPLFAGLVFYELCRSPFRRAPSESRLLNRAIGIAVALGALSAAATLPGWLPATFPGFPEPLRRAVEDAFAAAMMIGLAGACAMVLYGNLKRERD